MNRTENRENIAVVQYSPEHNRYEKLVNKAIGLPGQEVAHLGMFDQVCEFPAGREIVERADILLENEFGFKISEIAATPRDPRKIEENTLRLRGTQYTQPAVITLSVAVHNINRHHFGKDGYKNRPHGLTGNSMGMVSAGIIGGYFQDFETGLWLGARRGKAMKELGDPTPTAMVPVISKSREVIDEVLDNNPAIDLCLINAKGVYILGGPNMPDDPNSPLMKTMEELQAKKARVLAIVKTDRAMHGRYVRGAKERFAEDIKEIKDRISYPIIQAVGTLTGLPIPDPDGYIEELLYGFDNTFDNTKPHEYFDKTEVQVFSEVNQNGTFATSIYERAMEAIATHKLETAGITAGTIASLAGASFGIYEVMTKHHPHHPKKQKK